MAIKKKYNFKGLDKIFGESITDAVEEIEGNPSKAKELSFEVDLDSLKPNPFQPRKSFSSEQLEELSISIKNQGVIQPIIVKRNGSDFIIIAGERRTRAAKLAGLKKIPVIEIVVDDKKMEEYALIENIQRVDLLDIEEAIAYKNLSTNLNLKQEEIASKVGKSRSHVANIMRLLNLPEYIQNAMLDEKITMGQSKPLLSILSRESEIKRIFNLIIEKNLNSREVEKLVKDVLNPNNENIDNKKSINPNLENVQNKLSRRFGTKVSISDSKISINYQGVNDLNRILEIIGIIDKE